MQHPVATSQTSPISTIAFTGGWSLMVVAMMVPTIFPLLLSIKMATGSQRNANTKFSLCFGGFMAIWLIVGFALFFSGIWLQKLVEHVSVLELNSFLIPAVATGACGLYQFTHLKRVSMAKCREKMSSADANCFGCYTHREYLWEGLRQGLYSIGSCGTFMLLMFAADLGGIGWMALLAGAMLAERYAPSMNRTANVLGLGLTGAAVIYSLVFLL